MAMPEAQRSTPAGITAQGLLRAKIKETATVIVDLRTLLATRRHALFGMSQPFMPKSDRPQCLESIAVAVVEFIDRLTASRSPERIVFSAESPANQHPLRVAHNATADYANPRLRAPYSRSDETCGFLPLVFSDIEAAGDVLPRSLLLSPLGASITRGGLLETDLLLDRRMAPIFCSLLFQTVFAMLRTRAESTSSGSAGLSGMVIIYAGPIYNFAALCNKDEHPFLPNTLMFSDGARTVTSRENAAYYALPDPAACLLLVLSHLYAKDEDRQQSTQIEVLSDSDAVALAAVLYHERQPKDKALIEKTPPQAILVWMSDQCVFDAGLVAVRYMPDALAECGLDGTAQAFAVLYMAFFGTDGVPKPLGFDATNASFRRALQGMALGMGKNATIPPLAVVTLVERTGFTYRCDTNAVRGHAELLLLSHLVESGYVANEPGNFLVAYLRHYVRDVYPEWHPLQQFVREDRAFADYAAEQSLQGIAPDRLSAVSVGLLQTIRPQTAHAELYQPTEADLPRIMLGDAVHFPMCRGRLRRVVSRDVRREAALAIKNYAETARNYAAYQRDVWDAQTRNELRGAASATNPCPLEVGTGALALRAVAIANALLMLYAGHLPGARAMIRNRAVDPQWAFSVDVPAIARDATDDVTDGPYPAPTTDAYAALEECGLAMFTHYPGAPIADTVLMRRAHMLNPSAAAAIATYMDEALPKWRDIFPPPTEHGVPPCALPALLRCLVADAHGEPGTERVIETPLPLAFAQPGTETSLIVYPTTRTPEVPGLCNPGISSGHLGGLLLPFTYSPPAGAVDLLDPNAAATLRPAAQIPVGLFTDDGAVSAVWYADNEEDYEDTAAVAATVLYLDALHERCAVPGAGRVPERLVLALSQRAEMAEAGETRREVVDAALDRTLLSFSPDVVTYGVPMLMRNMTDAVWTRVMRPAIMHFRRPMEAAFRALCLWKASETVAAAYMASAAVTWPAASASTGAFFGLEAFFGENARAAADAVLKVRAGDWPDEVHGTWCTAALALRKTDLRMRRPQRWAPPSTRCRPRCRCFRTPWQCRAMRASGWCPCRETPQPSLPNCCCRTGPHGRPTTSPCTCWRAPSTGLRATSSSLRRCPR